MIFSFIFIRFTISTASKSLILFRLFFIYWSIFFSNSDFLDRLTDTISYEYIRIGSSEPYLLRVGSARTSPSMTVIRLTFWQICRKVVTQWQYFWASPKRGIVYLLMLQQVWCWCFVLFCVLCAVCCVVFVSGILYIVLCLCSICYILCPITLYILYIVQSHSPITQNILITNTNS